MLLEVCVDSIQGAAAAQAGGAERIELCSALCEGGITPSAGLMKACRGAFRGKMMVLIRPRGGDFVYTEDEQLIMLDDIQTAKSLGADGVVFGCLRLDGSVDMEATGRLWSKAKCMGLDATFHRAFDMTADPIKALDALVTLGLPRVLTSGCRPSALQGAEVIGALVRRSAGRIAVLAGGGVTAANAAEVVARTGVSEVHSSAKRAHSSPMVYRRPCMSLVSPNPPRDFEWSVADEGIVRQLMEALGPYGEKTSHKAK